MPVGREKRVGGGFVDENTGGYTHKPHRVHWRTGCQANSGTVGQSYLDKGQKKKATQTLGSKEELGRVRRPGGAIVNCSVQRKDRGGILHSEED